MSSSSYPPPAPPASLLNSFPGEAWFSLSVFLVVVGLFQWGSVLHSKVVGQRRPREDADEESRHVTPSARPRASGGWWVARLPLAAVNVFRVVAFRWTIELGPYDLTMVDVVLTLAYIAFLLGWTFGGGGGVEGQYNIMNWTNRAGLLAASQFPLITVLGTKNNILSLITGVSYEKLNYFHRVTARSCFGLLLIHAGGKLSLFGSYLNTVLTYTWIRLAITAMAALAILFIVSLRGIRSRAYEVFFYTHFIAVLIVLIGAYFHTKETNFSYWIWPSFVFWGLDRLIRVVRVVVFNHLYCGFSRGAKLQDATTELLSDNLVRLRVRRPPHFRWSPGQAAYLIMPSVSTFPLAAHPFSISSVDSHLFQPGASNQYSQSTSEVVVNAEDANWKELVFLINVRGGFTKRLREVAAQNQTVKLFIDGPYGFVPDMGAYDTCILVAGGAGVTHTLPVFLSVIQAARKRSGRCQRVVFIWAIRDPSHVQWISDALSRAKALTPAWLTVSIRIFATRGNIPFSGSGSVDPDQTPDKEGSYESYAPPSFRLESGRPDLKSILRDEVSAATGSMSVTVCGSQSVARSVRRALRFPVSGPHSVLNGGPSVTLHVESFGYA